MYPVQSKRNLGEQAYDRIREAIITLVFKPGQMVYESELGNWLGMSRTPVREGIRMLLVEDLIEVLPQRGLRVSLISVSKVEDIRFVRESLEVSAFQRVALLWDPETRACQDVDKRIGQLLEEQRSAARDCDVLRFLYFDEEFHRTILDQTHNGTLISVVSQMRGHLNRVRILGLRGHAKMDALIDEHEALWQCIVARDPSTMEDLLTKHLRRLRQDLGPLQAQYREYFTQEPGSNRETT